MKIHDFDEKFFDYVRTWMALHPGMTEKQVEQSYNEIMLSWLNAPATWLGGETPGTWFNRWSDPKDLMKLLEEYDKRDIGLPEPLYSRIASLGEVCAQPLTRIASDRDRPESLRATAMALLRDIGSKAPLGLYIDMVTSAREENELCEMASDILSEAGPEVVDALLDRYDDASEYAQTLILDICANHPGSERLFRHLLDKLLTQHERRAYFASLLEKLGDPRALPALEKMLSLSDLGYVDYIEIRNAVESLGGDAGEERTFYGDPDYEAMRNV